MTQEQIQEIRYLVGEAWKGAYNPTTVYGNANVVQDTEGLSVYRSLKPGNSGHPLTDQQWWFKIIDMSSIKALYDQMVEGNNTMAENELERVAAEQSRVSAEQSRVNAENTRIYNENQRINDETTRVRAEQDRVTQENQRISQEQGRVGAEQQRVVKEQQRVNQEASRVAAETQRQLNENDRQAVFAEDHAVAVADHQQAEQDHTRAESDHETAVSDHGQMTDLVERADADHVQAGNDHTRAESDHSTAASDHTQAGQDHTTAAADHTQAGNDHTRAESDHTRAESDHAAVEVYVDSLGVFDLSKHNAEGGVLATYADLSAALTALNALESKYKYGGMSFKFVQSSDNKYVQCRLMSDTFNTTEANWQGVDDKPNGNTDNLVKSSGVYNYTPSNKPDDSSADLNIGDVEGNVIAEFKEGHIKTKHFDSRDSCENKYDFSESDLNIGDAEGNTIVEFKNGHVKTKHFDSRAEGKKKIKILFIGNSITQDHAAYLPLVIKHLLGDSLNFKIGIFYMGGQSIAGYAANPENIVAEIYSTVENTYSWSNQFSSVKLKDAIQSDYWDVISLQGYWRQVADSPSYEDMTKMPILVSSIRNNALKSFELAYLMHQDFHGKFNDIMNGGKTAVKDNPVSILFAPLFTTEFAKAYFTQQQLTPDACHMMEGLPCLIGAYHLAFIILRRLGFLCPIIGDKLRITRELWLTLNIPGANGSVDESYTESDYFNAQFSAIKGIDALDAFFESVKTELYDELI